MVYPTRHLSAVSYWFQKDMHTLPSRRGRKSTQNSQTDKRDGAGQCLQRRKAGLYELHKGKNEMVCSTSDRANQIRGSDIMVTGWENSIDNVWVISALFPRKIAAYKHV